MTNAIAGIWQTTDASAVNAKIVDLNTRLQALCLEKNIQFIELYNLFLDPTTNMLNLIYTIDGVHLSREGYELWVDTITPYLVN